MSLFYKFLLCTETEPEDKTTGSTTESSLKTTTAESPSLETTTVTANCPTAESPSLETIPTTGTS